MVLLDGSLVGVRPSSVLSILEKITLALESSKKWPLRAIFRTVHSWLGIGIFLLLTPVTLSGSILVYQDEILAWMRSSPGAISKTEGVSPDAIVIAAREAVGDSFRPYRIRFPESTNASIEVALRGSSKPGERAATRYVYFDPARKRVTEVVNPRATFFGVMHVFHENLTIPSFYGRDIVGWTGVTLLILSMTGLYLWLPRRRNWARALHWCRTPSTPSNMHHYFGFWISLPLAFLALTGIYLAWPQQGGAVLSTVAPMTPTPKRDDAGRELITPILSATEVYNAVLVTNRKVSALHFPTRQNSKWRVVFHETDGATPSTILIDDTTKEHSELKALTGDRIALWIRWLHEGSYSGHVWRFIVFTTGIMPSLLGITGVMIWLRKRRQRPH